MINFVSNLPQDLRSGGFSGLNAAAFVAINKLGAVHYVGPINPPVFMGQKLFSKLLRATALKGKFFFYSERRLQAIAEAVHSKCFAEAQLDCFHGFTPWILTKPQHPYIAWSDCTFRDYIDIYHCRDQFGREDLERIERAEATWLRNAHRVLFTSDWAAKRAVSHYVLDASRVDVVGLFGQIEAPARDAYAGGKEFAFIATNFETKGGRVVLSAFREVKKRHSDASLVVIGDHPSDVALEPGVEFTGFLRKEVPAEFERYREILSRVRALLHPTRSDIAPLVVIEAGYFGCPAVTSKKFAIPELVYDGRSGILLDNSKDVGKLVDAMTWMLDRESEYRQMRQAAWAKAHGQHSKALFEKRLLCHLLEFIPGAEMPKV
jgi:glycosyltransferase involved in cell wall biosynthesis